MITTRSWLGISSPDWFIYSDTPHSRRWATQPTPLDGGQSRSDPEGL